MGHIDPCGSGPAVGGIWTSTGTILVLYILLVIVLRSPFFYC